MKKMLIASTSTVHGSGYLEYLMPELRNFLEGVDDLLFIPYARPGGISHDQYTDLVREALERLNISVRGIHEFDSPSEAVEAAGAIFTGGGNTFVLLENLYREGLLKPIRSAVQAGVPYIGTSAGSNITGPSIMTTNDMPITDPPSLAALGLIPYNLNPHYLDPDPKSTHKGETRETRIKEFHCYNDEVVIGLREGSWIAVSGEQMLLKGAHSARIFKKGKEALELEPGSRLDSL